MPKIEQWIIDRVMDAANIVDVVGESIRLRKAGVNFTGLCPFHDDQNDGNFIVTPPKSRKHPNKYHCFVCGADGNCVDFLMRHDGLTYPDAIRYLGKKYSIEVDNVPVNYTPPPPRPAPPPPPPLEIPREWVSGMMRRGYECNFIRWLYTLPWSSDERTRLQRTLWQYCVSGYKDGRVVFWQIDHEGVPRSAKLMRYLDDGHRDKTAHPGWLYNQQGIRERLDPDQHTILKPLFGSHLLKGNAQAVVNVVESEKTAIIMANYFGDANQLWLACGGLKFLKLEAMQPLIDQGRTVWLWPDKDGVTAWQEVADKLGADNIRVYTDFFDRCYIPEEDGPKADVADIAIRLMGGGRWPEQKHTGDPQPPTRVGTGGSAAATPDPSDQPPEGILPEEWEEHKAIVRAIKEWQLEHPNDEPFYQLTPLQQLMHDRVEESKRRKKLERLKPNQDNGGEQGKI